jgi:hypothetical protein
MPKDVRKTPSVDTSASRYPFKCDLCNLTIESVEDLDWHGYGNCAEITDEMWAEWEKESDEDASLL